MSITDPALATAGALAGAYHERWEAETANKQIKTYLRGPGRSCGPRAPTWSARRYTDTSSPTTPWRPDL